MDKLQIIVYHKNLCPWCIAFMPIWEKLKNNPKYKNLINFIDIEKKDFIEKKEKCQLQEHEKAIKTFPTLVFNFKNNYEIYNSETRDEITMCNKINKLLEEQRGGKNIDYRKKYLKYKIKYRQLLKKIEK
jgi:thiol-disulfide isomerase/thioredoxin